MKRLREAFVLAVRAHGHAVPPARKALVVIAAPDHDALLEQRRVQLDGRREQQIVGNAFHHAHPGILEGTHKEAALVSHVASGALQKTVVLQRGNARHLGRRRDRPGLARRTQAPDEALVGADSVAEPQPRHRIGLRERAHDDELRETCRQVECAFPVREIEEALVEHHARTRRTCRLQHRDEHLAVHEQASRVVGRGDKDETDARHDIGRDGAGQRKAVFFAQQMAHDLRARLLEYLLVSRIARGAYQRLLRAHDRAHPGDQVACPRRADELPGRDALRCAQRVGQRTARRVGIGRELRHRLAQRTDGCRRHPERVDVCREVEHPFVGVDVAAVLEATHAAHSTTSQT